MIAQHRLLAIRASVVSLQIALRSNSPSRTFWESFLILVRLKNLLDWCVWRALGFRSSFFLPPFCEDKAASLAGKQQSPQTLSGPGFCQDKKKSPLLFVCGLKRGFACWLICRVKILRWAQLWNHPQDEWQGRWHQPRQVCDHPDTFRTVPGQHSPNMSHHGIMKETEFRSTWHWDWGPHFHNVLVALAALDFSF